MIELIPHLSLLIWQPEPLRLSTDMVRFALLVGLFLVVVVVSLVFVLRAVKPKTDMSASGQLREEFNKNKDTLLLAVQARKAQRESLDGAERQRDAEEQEIELLKQSVNPQLIIGRTCPLCGLEMVEDQELVIDPYTGQGYHFSSFLMDWPPGTPRPKYIYRYPQDTLVKTSHVVSDF